MKQEVSVVKLGISALQGGKDVKMHLNHVDTLVAALRENPGLALSLEAYLVELREARRAVLENSAAEAAIVMRGQCQALTAVINQLFKVR